MIYILKQGHEQSVGIAENSLMNFMKITIRGPYILIFTTCHDYYMMYQYKFKWLVSNDTI